MIREHKGAVGAKALREHLVRRVLGTIPIIQGRQFCKFAVSAIHVRMGWLRMPMTSMFSLKDKTYLWFAWLYVYRNAAGRQRS